MTYPVRNELNVTGRFHTPFNRLVIKIGYIMKVFPCKPSSFIKFRAFRCQPLPSKLQPLDDVIIFTSHSRQLGFYLFLHSYKCVKFSGNFLGGARQRNGIHTFLLLSCQCFAIGALPLTYFVQRLEGTGQRGDLAEDIFKCIAIAMRVRQCIVCAFNKFTAID